MNDNNSLYIKPEYLAEIIKAIQKTYPKAIIWAYGSRVNNTAHPGSDLDLAVKDFGTKDRTTSKLSKLNTELKDSKTPFLIDLVEFDALPISFQTEITQNYIEIYNGQLS